MNKLKDRVIEVHSLRAGIDFGARRLEIWKLEVVQKRLEGDKKCYLNKFSPAPGKGKRKFLPPFPNYQGKDAGARIV